MSYLKSFSYILMSLIKIGLCDIVRALLLSYVPGALGWDSHRDTTWSL